MYNRIILHENLLFELILNRNGREMRRLGSAFHLMYPGYSRRLSSTALTAIDLWENVYLYAVFVQTYRRYRLHLCIQNPPYARCMIFRTYV